MRKAICLIMAVFMLFGFVNAVAQEPADKGVLANDDAAAVPADMIASLENEIAVATARIEAEGNQSEDLYLQERAFDGFAQGRFYRDLELEVYVYDTSVTVGEEIYIEVHFKTPYTPVSLVRTELLTNSSFESLGTTGFKTGTSYYNDGYFYWSYTPSHIGYVTFVITVKDAAGNKIQYSTPTVMVNGYDDKPYKGAVNEGGLSILLEMSDTDISVNEKTNALFLVNTDEETAIYACAWTLTDFDDLIIDDWDGSGVIYSADNDVLVSGFTPEQPGYLRFMVTAFTKDGDEVTINSPLITVYPYIDVSLNKESAMYGETVTATYDVEWPGKSPYLQGYWTFTDENGNATNEWVKVSSSGGTVSYTADKPGTLKFTVVATLNGKEYKRSTEEITLHPYNITVWLDKSSVAFGGEITAHYAVKWYGEKPEVEACWELTADGYEYNTWVDVTSDSGKFTYTPECGEKLRFYVHAIVDDVKKWKYSSYATFTGTPLRDNPVYVNTRWDSSSATFGSPISASYSIGNYSGNGWVQVTWHLVDEDGKEYTYYESVDESKTTGTLSMTPAFGETISFCVFVDDNGYWYESETSSMSISGTPLFDAPKVSLKLDKSSVNTGEFLTATYGVTGGPEDLEVDVVWYHVNEEGSEWRPIQEEYGVSKSGTSTLHVPYGPTIECMVMANHELLPLGVSESVVVPVYGDPVYGINLTLDKTTVMTGEYVTATYECVGYTEGSPSVSWYFYDADGNIISSVYDSEAQGLSGTSTVLVPYGKEVRCYVGIYSDTQPGASAEKSIPVTGYALYDPIKITASVDKTTVQSGSPLTFTYSVTGGKAPLDIWLHASTSTADASGYWPIANRYDLPDSGTEILVPYLGDEVSVSLYVTDADGNNASWYVWEEYSNIIITGAPEAEETKLTVTADKDEVRVGEPITVTYNFSTGNVPLGDGSYYCWNVSDQDGDGYAELLEEGEINQKSGTITYVPEDYAGHTLYFSMYVRNVYGQEHYSWDVEARIVGDGSRTPGDADNDNAVNILDALLTLQYAVGWNVEINLDNANVDGDDSVSILDALLILQYSVGWDVKLQ